MKNECGIIKDLLPLYAEGIAGPETVEFVEEHLKTCEACRQEYERMKEPKAIKPKAVQAETSAAPLLKLRRKMRTKKIQTVAVTALLVIALLVSAISFLNAPMYFSYSDNVISVTENDDGSVTVSFDESVTDYSLDLYSDGGASHSYYSISAWSTLWYKWFTNWSAQPCTLKMAESHELTLYYTSNNGDEDVCIYGDPLEGVDGITSLPRLTLGYYLMISVALFGILLAVRVIFRKKENIKIWIERIALYPLSYVIAHLLVLGFSFATYAIDRDFPLIIFISLLLWCGMLFAHNVFKARKEIKEISQALNE